MSNKKPDLRFRDFTANWEERELVDEFEKVNERNDGSFGINSWISVAKMYFQDPKKVQSNNIDTRTYVMRIGDIAFEGHPNTKFKFGRFVVNDIGPGVVSELFPIYRHMLDYDINYWKNAIQLEHIMAPIFAKSITSSGNSSNKLDTKHFLRQKIYIANFEEQQKIGTFFKRFDDSIALHQHALDLLKLRKKAFLQKMFPKKGESVPEIRFLGFVDNWKNDKLGDVVSVTMGQSPKGENYTNNSRDHVLVQGNADIKNGRVLPRVWTTQVTKTADIGDIIVSVRAPVGDIGTTDYNVVLGRGVAGIKGNQFIYQTLIRMKEIGYWISISTGSTFESINSKDLKEANILIPSETEQTKIGNFFKELDNSLTLQEEKLESLKQMKKAFLQKMFV